MFINFSNHPSEYWGKEQLEASKQYGEICDLSFPLINASADESEIKKIAEEYIEKILSLKPECVMCQGEFTLSYQIIKGLKENNIKVVAACSERKVEEIKTDDESIKKSAVFKFVKYRSFG